MDWSLRLGERCGVVRAAGAGRCSSVYTILGEVERVMSGGAEDSVFFFLKSMILMYTQAQEELYSYE